MRQVTLRFASATLTFIVGVTAVTLWVSFHHLPLNPQPPANPAPALSLPNIDFIHEQPASSPSASGDCSILAKLEAEFQRRNPNIAHVRIVDVRPTLTEVPKYLVLGWGIRADRTFRGNFEDELFGLFLVDESLLNVEKVMDFIPTPRWYDTEVRITRVDADKAVLEGRGETYGGRLFRREYDLRQEGRLPRRA